MARSHILSLSEGLQAAIAAHLDAGNKAALRLSCRALRAAVNATVKTVTIGANLALPAPSVFPRLSGIRFVDNRIAEDGLRGLAPALSQLPLLTSISTPKKCYVSRATLQALAAACPQLRELAVNEAGGCAWAAAGGCNRQHAASGVSSTPNLQAENGAAARV